MMDGGLDVGGEILDAVDHVHTTTRERARRNKNRWTNGAKLSISIMLFAAYNIFNNQHNYLVWYSGTLCAAVGTVGIILCLRRAKDWDGENSPKRVALHDELVGRVAAGILGNWYAREQIGDEWIASLLDPEQTNTFWQLAGDWHDDAASLVRAVSLLEPSSDPAHITTP